MQPERYDYGVVPVNPGLHGKPRSELQARRRFQSCSAALVGKWKCGGGLELDMAFAWRNEKKKKKRARVGFIQVKRVHGRSQVVSSLRSGKPHVHADARTMLCVW